ncbi:MAG: OmpA family protein [Desulfurivibrionaceae bacterium]
MLLNGCASKVPEKDYSPDLLKSQLDEKNLRQKTDRLIVVIDGQGGLELEKAYRLLQAMEKSIPSSVNYEKVFRIYGWDVESFSEEVSVLFGLNDQTEQGIEEFIVTKCMADSVLDPLSMTFDSLAMELPDVKGSNALVVISNGKHRREKDLESLDYLKKALTDRLCVYPVLMGDDSKGETHLETVAETGGCGYLAEGESLMSAPAMTDFVRDIFFTPAGVLPLGEIKEKEPDPAKETADIEEMLSRDKKIKLVLNVEFDFDKSEIRPMFHDEIKKVADFLKTYPHTRALLEGHTDSVGPESYNQKLSLRRARSVRNYLVDELGIDKDRLMVRGAGETEPVADNSSAAGRQRNRRMVAVIARQLKEFSSE